MSGGVFDYQQYRLSDIAERIRREINNNNIKPDWIAPEDWNGQKWTDETIAKFKRGVELLEQAEVYAQRIDWLLSGDDSEESFHKRLKEDWEELTHLPLNLPRWKVDEGSCLLLHPRLIIHRDRFILLTKGNMYVEETPYMEVNKFDY